MFTENRSSLNDRKLSIALILFSSAILLAWGFASAASRTWTYGDWTRDCQVVTKGVDGLYYDSEGAVVTIGNGWTVSEPFTDENGTTYTICGPEYYITSATFNASTDKDTYTPGETVTVSVSADNGWYGSGGTAVGVAAAFGGTQVAQCSLTNVCSASGSFTAPAANGTYTIQLSGCTVTSEYCANSTMAITVESPPPSPPESGGTPSVTLRFE
ncbi:MAG: hypothetical protein Q7S01_06535 [bacterium]|nr:hypothetical protein [bacterium]